MEEKDRAALSKILIALYLVTLALAGSMTSCSKVGGVARTAEVAAQEEIAWQIVRPGEPVLDFNDVHALNAERAWIVGEHGVIWHTRDGGKAWVTETIGTGKQSLSEVTFVDQNSGWIVGNDGIILHTDDSGGNWTQQESGTNRSLNAVSFVSLREGWIVGSGGIILHTKDGGQKWIQQESQINSRFVCLSMEKWFFRNLCDPVFYVHSADT